MVVQKKPSRKVYVSGSQTHYASWLPESWGVTKKMSEADLVMFTGGEDVSPSYYGETQGKLTRCNVNRDEYDVENYVEALSLDLPCIGICRGSQFLTAMQGGKLIQHVNNHGLSGTHKIRWFDGTYSDITSTHHQMCYPFDLSAEHYRILAWTPQRLSTEYFNGNNTPMNLPKDFVEPEIIYYPTTNCLGIQGHPEMMDYNHEGVRKLRILFYAFMNNQLV